MFYVVCRSLNERSGLIAALKENSIMAVFHYLSLHKSPYYSAKHDGRELPVSDHYSDNLLRLPFYYSLDKNDQDRIISIIKNFYK